MKITEFVIFEAGDRYDGLGSTHHRVREAWNCFLWLSESIADKDHRSFGGRGAGLLSSNSLPGESQNLVARSAREINLSG